MAKRRRGDLALRKRRESKALDGDNPKYDVKCPHCGAIYQVKMRHKPLILLRVTCEPCKAKVAKFEEFGRL